MRVSCFACFPLHHGSIACARSLSCACLYSYVAVMAGMFILHLTKRFPELSQPPVAAQSSHRLVCVTACLSICLLVKANGSGPQLDGVVNAWGREEEVGLPQCHVLFFVTGHSPFILPKQAETSFQETLEWRLSPYPVGVIPGCHLGGGPQEMVEFWTFLETGRGFLFNAALCCAF